MRAALRDRYGSPDVVELRDVDIPPPGDDEILVKVKAASVNRADLDALYAKPAFVRLSLGLRRPQEPAARAADAAGVVEAVGPSVTRFRPGDRVFADLYRARQGAFAEYACAPRAGVPADRRTAMSFEDAATLPHSAILALQGLRSGGRTSGPATRS